MIEAAVAAKMLEAGQLSLSEKRKSTAHLSQKGADSSLSFPIPVKVFFLTTGKGRVAWPCLNAEQEDQLVDILRKPFELTCPFALPPLLGQVRFWIEAAECGGHDAGRKRVSCDVRMRQTDGSNKSSQEVKDSQQKCQNSSFQRNLAYQPA